MTNIINKKKILQYYAMKNLFYILERNILTSLRMLGYFTLYEKEL